MITQEKLYLLLTELVTTSTYSFLSGPCDYDHHCASQGKMVFERADAVVVPDTSSLFLAF